MTTQQADDALAQLLLPSGFASTTTTDADGNAIVAITGPNDWLCQFSLPSQVPWAQAQIDAAAP
jgi:hypothetical protein